MLRLLLSALAVAPFVLASPHASRWNDFKVKHAWVDVPTDWVLHDEPASDATIDLRLAMKPEDDTAIIDALYEVSDPAHPRYGAHLSKAEVAALVAPHQNTIDEISAWLDHHGIPASSVSPALNGDWLSITAVPVEKANAMLGTKYGLYRHIGTNETVLRCTEYSVPEALHDHIKVVAPTTYFGTTRAMRATSFLQPTAATLDDGDHALQAEIAALQATGNFTSLATVPSSCGSTITPSCLRALYSTSAYTPAATSKNILGIAGYLEEFANTADLKTFLTKFRSDATSATFTTVEVNGGQNNQNDPGVEANLDIQYAEGISFPTPNIYYSTGGSPPFIADQNTPTNTNEPYLDWLDFILAQSTIPQTISTSYGDDEQTVPLDYATQVCNLFAQLGAQGTSILFSSGDSGVGPGSCQSNNGSRAEAFIPNFPASCPFVTSVGGTTKVNPEVAASLSSGGFSNYFARPSYQDTAVTTFLTKFGTTKFAGLFNRTGRGFPDVAAQAENFQVIVGGRTENVAGTSCASPTFAAVISLLNDFLISQGKSPLGFLNPFLYSTGASGLTDITSGSNPGCGTTGFTAGSGWDPVTGLGTPNFVALQSLVS